MSEKPKRKLCDWCGIKPFASLYQDVDKYDLMCEDCLKASRATELIYYPEARNLSKPGIYEAEVPE